MRAASLLPALLIVAACDGSTPTMQAPKAPEPPSDFQKQVAALTDTQRNAVFIRAIRDARFNCQGVTASHRQGEALNGDPLYVATCTDKQHYGIVMGRDGTAQVVARGER